MDFSYRIGIIYVQYIPIAPDKTVECFDLDCCQSFCLMGTPRRPPRPSLVYLAFYDKVLINYPHDIKTYSNRLVATCYSSQSRNDFGYGLWHISYLNYPFISNLFSCFPSQIKLFFTNDNSHIIIISQVSLIGIAFTESFIHSYPTTLHSKTTILRIVLDIETTIREFLFLGEETIRISRQSKSLHATYN